MCEIVAAASAVATVELLVGRGRLRPVPFLPLNPADDGADTAADVDELVAGAAHVMAAVDVPAAAT